MNDFDYTEGPSQVQVVGTLLGCALLAAFLQLLCEFAAERAVLLGVDGGLTIALLKLALAVFLAAATFRVSGLTLGDKLAWQRHWTLVLLWSLIPPILTLAIYPNFTRRPFHGATFSFWLLTPIAESLLFSGFVYGRMVKVFGKPAQNWRGALAPALLITAFLFALYFWPFLRNADEGAKLGVSYAQFQMCYMLLFSLWMLNVRRWTGTVWPCVLISIVVNGLMALL